MTLSSEDGAVKEVGWPLELICGIRSVAFLCSLPFISGFEDVPLSIQEGSAKKLSCSLELISELFSINIFCPLPSTFGPEDAIVSKGAIKELRELISGISPRSLLWLFPSNSSTEVVTLSIEGWIEDFGWVLELDCGISSVNLFCALRSNISSNVLAPSSEEGAVKEPWGSRISSLDIPCVDAKSFSNSGLREILLSSWSAKARARSVLDSRSEVDFNVPWLLVVCEGYEVLKWSLLTNLSRLTSSVEEFALPWSCSVWKYLLEAFSPQAVSWYKLLGYPKVVVRCSSGLSVEFRSKRCTVELKGFRENSLFIVGRSWSPSV